MPQTTRLLHQGWTLRPDGGPAPDHVLDHVRQVGPVPATVPGTVHTDLLAAGLVPDPYLDDNEALLAWVGLCDWVYDTTFAWAPGGGDRRTLVLHGLDTVATVTLNGAEVLVAADMHRTHVVDVTDRLLEGDNTLDVRFASAVRYADAQSARWPAASAGTGAPTWSRRGSGAGSSSSSGPRPASPGCAPAPP